jgi:pilus assembly protein CpaF
VTSVQEINGMEGDIITMSEIFAFRRSGVDEQGQVLGSLVPTGVVPAFHKRLSVRGFDLPTSTYRP